MSESQYLKLTLDNEDAFYNIETFNGNFRKIDAFASDAGDALEVLNGNAFIVCSAAYDAAAKRHTLTPVQVGIVLPEVFTAKFLATASFKAGDKVYLNGVEYTPAYNDSDDPVEAGVWMLGAVVDLPCSTLDKKAFVGMGHRSALENKSNPNITDNSNFAINQQGKIVYNTGILTVDRWHLTSGRITVLANGVRLSADGEFYQTFLTSEDKRIHNGIYTLSARIDGEVFSYTVTLDFTALNMAKGGYLGDSGTYVNIVCSWDIAGKLYVGLQAKGKQRDIQWIKLEEGNTATRYVHPNPADELARCQRFFEVMEEPMLLSKEWVGSYFAPYNGSFKQTKRVIPTITFENNTLRYYGEPQVQPPATVAVQTVTKSAIMSIVSSAAQLNDSVYGQGYVILGKIFADAEVY